MRFIALFGTLFFFTAVAIAADPPTTQPTMVTIKIDAKGGQQIAKEFAQQFGTPAQFYGQKNKRTIQFESQNAPIVATLLSFVQQTKLTPRTDTQPFGFEEGQPLAVQQVNDVIGVIVGRSYVTGNVNLPVTNDARSTSYNYRLAIGLIVDPALKIVSCDRNARIDALEHDGGKVNSGSQRVFYGDEARIDLSPLPVWPVHVGFSASTPATKINSLKASVTCLQVVEEGSVDVDVKSIDDAKPVEGKNLTAVVSFDDANRGQGGMSVKLTGPAAELYLDPQWQDQLRGAVQAFDADGKSLGLRAQEMQANAAEKSLTVQLRADGRGDDQPLDYVETVRIRLPMKVRAVEIPIELKDIPLP